MRNKIILRTRTLFLITIIVALLTTLSVGVYGSSHNNSSIDNSIVSVSILFLALFSFLSFGLYKGISITNDMKTVAREINGIRIPKLSNNLITPSFDGGDGIGGFIFGIIMWIVMTFFIWAFLLLFDFVIWAIVASLIAILYYTFYKALFYVFRNSFRCKEKLFRSLKTGFGYALLYTFWIYALLFFLQYYSGHSASS